MEIKRKKKQTNKSIAVLSAKQSESSELSKSTFGDTVATNALDSYSTQQCTVFFVAIFNYSLIEL